MSPARSSPEYLWCNFTRVSLHYYFSQTLSSEETKVPSVEKRDLELKLHELLALLDSSHYTLYMLHCLMFFQVKNFIAMN